MVEKALVPIEQKQVLFYDDEVTAVLVSWGTSGKFTFLCAQYVNIWG